MDEKQLLELSPGFKFSPSDEELVSYYLKRKLLGKKLASLLIPEVDIYKFAPWDLPDMAGWKGQQSNKWYFFCPRTSSKCHGSGRKIRATDIGYWKPAGKDKPVVGCKNEVVGSHKTFVFHVGRPSSGKRTDWFMREYSLEEQELAKDHEFVLCMIFSKDGTGSKASSLRMEAISDHHDDHDLLVPDNFLKPATSLQAHASQSEATTLASEIEQVILDTGTSSKNADTDQGEVRFPSEGGTLDLFSLESLDRGPSDLLSYESLSSVERGTTCSEASVLTSTEDGVPKSSGSETIYDRFSSPGRQQQRKDKLLWTQKVRVSSTLGLCPDDGLGWRKHGQRDILGARYPRSYYRCGNKYIEGCSATKQTQRSSEDIGVFEVTYRGEHTCNIARTNQPLLPHPSMPENRQQMINFTFSEPQEIIQLDDHLDTSQASYHSPIHFFKQTAPSNRASSSSIIDHHHHQYNKDSWSWGSFSPSFTSPSTSAFEYFFGDGQESFGNPNSELNNIVNGDGGISVSTGAEEELVNCRKLETFDLKTVDLLLLLTPSRSIALNLRPECLVEVYLPGCNDASVQNLVNLKQLDLSCSSFTRMPDLSRACKLQSLDLHSCNNLADVSSIQYLTKLEYINLKDCTSLMRLPSLMALKFLSSLDVSDCINLRRLPPSLGCLSSLTALDLRNCKRIQNLPKGILRLKSVQTLFISGCSMLMEHASGPEGMVVIERQENPIAHSSSHSTDEEVSTSYQPVDKYVSKIPLQQPEEEIISSKCHSMASKDAAEPSPTTQDVERQREVLKEYMNMPVEAIHQANAFCDVQRTVGSLTRQSSDPHESASLQDLMYCLEELQENVPETMARMHDARVSRGSFQVKLAHLGSSFVQTEEHYSELAARLLVISDEEEDLDAEIERLLAKKRELLD